MKTVYVEWPREGGTGRSKGRNPSRAAGPPDACRSPSTGGVSLLPCPRHLPSLPLPPACVAQGTCMGNSGPRATWSGRKQPPAREVGRGAPCQAHGVWVTWEGHCHPENVTIAQQGSILHRMAYPRTQSRGRTRLAGATRTWQASCGQGVGQGHADLRHPVPLQQSVAGDALPLLQHRQGQGGRARDHQPAGTTTGS